MEYIIKGYEPESFFRFFEDISAIPRSSGEEKQISDFLMAFAKTRGLDAYQDQHWNVIIKKAATAGKENHSAVMLQGHLDMVCEKNAATIHDFSTEGIKLVLEDGFLRAEGTTLGADNGVAVAMMMAILDDKSLSHPPLECVFTVQEETGLTGAETLDTSRLAAETMINLDSETEGIATVSCAGGVTMHVDCVYTAKAAKGQKALKITLGGLLGGHSGSDIHLERANANLLMGRLLNGVFKEQPLNLAAINGGNKDNAIPRECEAVILAKDLSQAAVTIKNQAQFIQQELLETEPNFWVALEEIEIDSVIDDKNSEAIIKLLILAPNGVFNRNINNGDFVVSSSNLGVIRTYGDKVQFIFSLRSSVASLQEQSVQKIESLGALLHFKTTIISQYPGWAYAEKSPIRDLYQEVYQSISGNPLVCEAIHAGLECGLFMDKMPNLDAIAVGPQIDNCHTPNECLNLASCALNYKVLTAVLAKM